MVRRILRILGVGVPQDWPQLPAQAIFGNIRGCLYIKCIEKGKPIRKTDGAVTAKVEHVVNAEVVATDLGDGQVLQHGLNMAGRLDCVGTQP